MSDEGKPKIPSGLEAMLAAGPKKGAGFLKEQQTAVPESERVKTEEQAGANAAMAEIMKQAAAKGAAEEAKKAE
ncbi:hypothetical protein FVE85_4725 [Porphyridium purpureum]|uniref:Uncharacterized protein n=1 Tax=Porphyridium purpureum TaxID=35688 RepID=A0A5J4YQJ1_PORPP|nr:hypothetical protein FVE85_4725 [Porphyridium purpureum]|eukprot:POR6540..scf236_6